jgi:hypothetical protein
MKKTIICLMFVTVFLYYVYSLCCIKREKYYEALNYYDKPHNHYDKTENIVQNVGLAIDCNIRGLCESDVDCCSGICYQINSSDSSKRCVSSLPSYERGTVEWVSWLRNQF